MTPQLNRLARHFVNHGTITNVEAHAVYGMRSVSSRVSELRRLGMPIQKEQRKDALGQRYTRYALAYSDRNIWNGRLAQRGA